MPLPASWIDHLFGRLAVRYGAAFLRQWPDADIAAVKADWADVLDGYAGESIAYALRYLPAAPPNAIAFRDQCRRAPRAEAKALPAPAPDPDAVARVMAAIRNTQAAGGYLSPAQQCISNIRAASERGRLTPSQRHVLRSCEAMLTRADEGARDVA